MPTTAHGRPLPHCHLDINGPGSTLCLHPFLKSWDSGASKGPRHSCQGGEEGTCLHVAPKRLKLLLLFYLLLLLFPVLEYLLAIKKCNITENH